MIQHRFVLPWWRRCAWRQAAFQSYTEADWLSIQQIHHAITPYIDIAIDDITLLAAFALTPHDRIGRNEIELPTLRQMSTDILDFCTEAGDGINPFSWGQIACGFWHSRQGYNADLNFVDMWRLHQVECEADVAWQLHDIARAFGSFELAVVPETGLIRGSPIRYRPPRKPKV